MTTEKPSKRDEFLNRLTMPIEKVLRENKDNNKFKYQKPHKALHDFHTIKWLRSRFDDKVFKRSINMLLPNNGIPVEDPNKDPPSRIEQAKEYLIDFCQPEDKFKNFKIPPKYLYSKLIMAKINKLKDIFLEFDQDGSRKLEINEMVVMFNRNKIPVVEEELVELFFKDKKLKKDEEPYLDFYQFMLFALSKASDQDFRVFMRKLKKKKADETKKQGKRQSLRLQEKEEENLFLPMNFNLVLDYFNNKGKQRDSESKIKDAIGIMEEIINGKKETTESGKLEDSQMNGSEENSFSESEDANKEKMKKEDDLLEIHNKINTEALFDEFRKLFGQKHASEKSHNANVLARKLLGLRPESSDKSHNSRMPSRQYERNTPAENRLQTNTETYHEPEMKITEFLKFKDQDNMTKSSLGFYNKYKSLYLAAEETKKKFGDLNSRQSTKYSNFRTTAGSSSAFSKTKQTFNCNTKNNFNVTNGGSHFGKTGFSSTNMNFYKKEKEYTSSQKRINTFSAQSNMSKQSEQPRLPEITSKQKSSTGFCDYIPLNLMKELNPSNQNGNLKHSNNS